MLDFLRKLCWRLYFLVRGAPTVEQLDADVARLYRRVDDPAFSARAGQYDCAVYTSAGDFMKCYPGMEEYQCHALAVNGRQVSIMKLGSCRTLPH